MIYDTLKKAIVWAVTLSVGAIITLVIGNEVQKYSITVKASQANTEALKELTKTFNEGFELQVSRMGALAQRVRENSNEIVSIKDNIKYINDARKHRLDSTD